MQPQRPSWRGFSTRGAGGLTVGEGLITAAPARTRRQGSGQAAARSLPPGASRGLTRVSLAFLVMASFSPRCEIRQLAVFVYPGGIKAPDAERITVFYGRRGRPVKKPRFIPAQLAHQLARKLQAKRLGTVAVL
jgi:hypothetical protein